MFASMTEVTSGQIFKLHKILHKYVQCMFGQNTADAVTAEKYKNRFHLLNLSPSERTRETAKLIHLWSLLKKNKTRVGASLTGFNLDCCVFDKTRLNVGFSVTLKTRKTWLLFVSTYNLNHANFKKVNLFFLIVNINNCLSLSLKNN